MPFILHSIKGSAANIGATQICSLISIMEGSLKKGEISFVEKNIPALTSANKLTLAKLSLWIEENSQS